MATLFSINKRANTKIVSLSFFFFLLLVAAAVSGLVWFFTKNLEHSLATGGALAALFWLWWYLYEWQSDLTWLCRLQIYFFGAGALPDDHRFSDDVLPWNTDDRIKELVKTATESVQEITKSLAANRYAMDKYLGSQASRRAMSGTDPSKPGRRSPGRP